ncbi:Wnt-activated receptor [Balamuthia mandrillaris]
MKRVPLAVVVFFVVLSCLSALPAVVRGDSASMSEPQGPNAHCRHISNYTDEELYGICRNLLTYEWIYEDDNAQFRQTFPTLFTTYMGVTGEPCLSATWRMICAGTFRECIRAEAPEGHPSHPAVAITNRYTCRNICDHVHDVCWDTIANTIAQAGTFTVEEVLDCDVPWFLFWGYPTLELFPRGEYTIPVTADNGTSFFNTTISCYDGNRNLTTAIEVTCPTGLHATGAPGACAFDCPHPIISEEEYHQVEVMISVTSWISLTTTLLVVISYALIPSKRSFPGNLPLFFVVAITCRAFAFCLGSMAGHENVWCDGDEGFNTFGDPLCTLQGIMFVYFTLAGALWWFIITLNLFLSTVIGWEPNDHLIFRLRLLGVKFRFVTMEAVFHVCAWVLPFIPLIIALSGEQLGYAGSSFWCTIHSGGGSIVFQATPEGTTHSGTDDNNLWNLLLLTLPILVIVFVGVILLAMVAIFGLMKSRDKGKFVLRQWRLFAFILLYIWIYLFVLSFQIHFKDVQDQQYSAYDEYIDCLYIFTTAGQYDPSTSDESRCELDQKVNFALWFIVTFNEVAQGFFVFLIFGTAPDVLRAWYSGLVQCHWQQSFFTTSSSAVSSSTSSSSVKEESEMTSMSKEEKRKSVLVENGGTVSSGGKKSLGKKSTVKGYTLKVSPSGLASGTTMKDGGVDTTNKPSVSEVFVQVVNMKVGESEESEEDESEEEEEEEEEEMV